MDWIRKHKTLAAIIVAMVVGGLGLGAVLVMSYFGYAGSMEQFTQEAGKVATIKGAKLFPSQQHVDEREAAVSEYEAEVGKLGTVLLTLQQPVKPLSDTAFQAGLKDVIAQTRSKAEAKKTVLPKEFSLGFEKYNTSLPRSAEAAAQLGDYLNAAAAVADLLIDSGAKSIDQFERTPLIVESDAPPPAAPKPEPKKPVPSAASKRNQKSAAKAGPPPKEIAKIVERRTVTARLTTDQGALQKIMNVLASPTKMVHFTVVRLLRVDNKAQEGPIRGSLPKLNAGPPPGVEGDPTQPSPDAGAATPPAADVAKPVVAQPPPKNRVIEPTRPANQDAQAVFGEEDLQVYLEIDLVRFLEPKSSDSAEIK